ncbi:MAG: isoprenylcysteine carboxyl methyltransferase [Anaerolinea sp.]|nr:isoprenylcysteine carboxyl methyltransferase [Anaerolinea sp.]
MEKKTTLLNGKTIFQLILVVIIFPLLPILITWQWNWWEAWVFAIILFLGFIFSRILAARKNPGIIAERANSLQNEGAKSWDKLLAPMMALGGVIVPLIAGLDKRFDWSAEPYTLPIKIAAIVVMLLAYIFSSCAMIENAYFSGIVRIQTDRGQTVCSSGPYHWVRHPGYVGAIWSYLAMPFLLDSKWALIAVAALFVITLIRTKLEDQTLRTELPGYSEYAAKVKYRLFPGVW